MNLFRFALLAVCAFSFISHAEARPLHRHKAAPFTKNVFETPLQIGQTYQESIVADGTNEYSFTTDADGIYRISITGGDTDLSWDLWDDTETIFEYCDESNLSFDESCAVYLPGKTFFYMVINEWGGRPATYNLSLEQQKN